MRKLTFIPTVVTLAVFPLLVSAVDVPVDVRNFIGKVLDTFVNPVIILMFAAATLNLLANVVKYAFNYEKFDRTKLKNSLVWSVIGVAIMASVFGILQMVISMLKSAGVETLGS